MDGNTLMVINASRLFSDTPVEKVRFIAIAPSIAHINLGFADSGALNSFFEHLDELRYRHRRQGMRLAASAHSAVEHYMPWKGKPAQPTLEDVRCE